LRREVAAHQSARARPTGYAGAAKWGIARNAGRCDVAWRSLVKSQKDLEPYFREAASWDADRAAMAGRSARIAWWTAGAGWLCAVASAAAIAVLTPLKTVAPFVIRVDNTSGLVDVVPVYAGNSTFPETVTRYLLAHYVDVCERFTWGTAESDYEECGSFNSARRNQAWAAQWVTANPTSPLNLYKDGTTIRPHIISVTFFKRANGVADLAQIRYTKGKRTGDDAAEDVTHWIATIQYAYVSPSQDVKTRQWNPLGFRVVDFHSEPEVLTDSAQTPSNTTATSAVAGRTP
jgi:type IV secretion system protein VirB8